MFGGGTCVGIDIGRYSVKVAVLEAERQQIRLLKQSDTLPPPWTERLDGDDELVAQLRAIVPLLPHGRRTVSAAIEGDGVWCQYLEMPPVAEGEMAIAVRSAARKHVPFALDEATVSFVPLTPSPGCTLGHTNVLVVAARRELVERYTRCMNAAGIRLDRLDINPLAAARAFTANQPGAGGVRVLLDVGARWTHVVLTQDGCPRSIRCFSPAVGDFVHALATGTRSSWAEAEQHLRQHDFAARERHIEAEVDRWTGEVARTIAAFSQRVAIRSEAGSNSGSRKVQISDVTLSGGGALLRGLDVRLGLRLEQPVDVERWKDVRWSGSEPAALYMTAIGLALKG